MQENDAATTDLALDFELLDVEFSSRMTVPLTLQKYPQVSSIGNVLIDLHKIC